MTDKIIADKKALELLETEIKLYINRCLFEKGAISEKMYIKAKDYIMRTEQ